MASWVAEPTVTRGTAPPTPRHSPGRPCCRQMVSKAPRTLCGERVQGHWAAPPSREPEQRRDSGAHLVLVLVPHGHGGHRLGL